MLMAESDQELTSLLKRVKEKSEKIGLKLNSQETKTGLITLCQMEGEKLEAVTDFVFLASKITAVGDCSYGIQRLLLLGKKL